MIVSGSVGSANSPQPGRAPTVEVVGYPKGQLEDNARTHPAFAPSPATRT